MSKCIMINQRLLKIVLENVVITGEEKTVYKTEDAVVKTGERHAGDLCKAK